MKRRDMRTRRTYPRRAVRKDAIARYNGQSGWVLNISKSGLSILYSNPAQWPDSLALDLVFMERGVAIDGIKCSRTWESGMDSVTVLGGKVMRRRGLRFDEPDSPEIKKLMEVLDIPSS